VPGLALITAVLFAACGVGPATNASQMVDARPVLR
jgi:hypothetical protein